MFSQFSSLEKALQHCTSYTGGKKRPFLMYNQAYKTAEKECVLVSEGSHVLYKGSFLLFRVMTCYNCASFPKSEIRALFALIIFEIPRLTGISGSVLPRGHHLKLPMEKSQLRVSSWRKQFSCITSSTNSACESGSQERQKQQMRYRSGKEDPSVSVGAALWHKLGAGRGELVTALK